MEKKYSKKDIAIIGMSGRFPKSMNIDEFWQRLTDGELLSQFYTDEELIELGVDKHRIKNENFVNVSTMIDQTESFDYAFFGYTKDEASLMDPQIRVMHEQVWMALEDANLTRDLKERIGVYLAASDNINWRAFALMAENDKVNPFFKTQLTDKNFISTLISYSLNLKGPSYYMDTACSSSLVSAHVACRSLLMQECTVAVAGGVSIKCTNDHGYIYKEGMINSKDGYCKTFDSKASGTIGGEGAGVVVLKRLENAIKDGDNIYAVIKSSAVNNDGKRKVGYAAPSVKGQSECIKMAHQIAGVKPNLISYVEAHGTGTKIGDPIEIEALNIAFEKDSTSKCAIGSVKTNMGHLDAAAGAAGLIKTTLAIKNKLIPASLHYENPNTEIDFDGGPFFVNTELKKWKNIGENPLFAGVSGFGIGGTNAHLVLSEFVREQVNDSKSRPYQLITYSAKTKNALDRYNNKLKAYVENDGFEDLPNLAYTQKTGRKDFNYRQFQIGKNKTELLNNWEPLIIDQLKPAAKNRVPNVVFMFPGQGSQYFGIAKDLYKQEKVFKEAMDLGFALLKKESGKDFKAIIGFSDEHSNKDLITNTENTQPLLFLVEYALSKLLFHWGITPSKMIGHSLGEYTAACLADVFSVEQGLKILLKRGELMGALSKGSMVGIGASAEIIGPLLNQNISIAAVNTDQTCVVSGKDEILEELMKTLTNKGIAFTKLKTSHAFHSEMMDDMLDDFREVLKDVEFADPTIPFISNLTGKEVLPEDVKNVNYWVKHLRETVKFSEGIKAVIEPNSVYVEVGPGSTLSGFLRQATNNGNEHTIISLIRHPKQSVNDNEKLATGIGMLWSAGVKLNWEAYYEDENRTKIAIPKYSFEKSNFQSRINPLKDFNIAGNRERGTVSNWLYEPSWKRESFPISVNDETNDQLTLIFDSGSELTERLHQTFKEKKERTILVKNGDEVKALSTDVFQINFQKEEHYKYLFDELVKNESLPNNIVCLLKNTEHNDLEIQTSQLNFYELLYIAKGLNQANLNSKVKLVVVSTDLHDVLGVEQQNLGGAMTQGLSLVISQENPLIRTQCIDVSKVNNNEAVVPQLYREILSKIEKKIVSFRHGKRWVKTYNPIQVNEAPAENSTLKNKGVYLITGGLGGLGFVYAKHLLQKYNARVILTGRSNLSDNQGHSEKLKRLNELKAMGQVSYHCVDSCDLQSMKELMLKEESVHGQFNGVIHAAGIIKGESFKVINFLQKEDCQSQFKPKVDGLCVLEQLFKDRQLDFCLLTSSLSTIIGGKEFGAYAAANMFMDFFAQNTAIKNCMSLNYDGLGLQTGKRGGESLAEEEVIEILEKVLVLDDKRQVIVSIQNLKEQIARWVYPQIIEVKEEEKSEIDRAALTSSFVAPSTETEIKLVEIFEEFFSLSNLGINDGFFELGGDSLKAMNLIHQFYKSFNVEITLADFFEFQSIQKLAAAIDTRLVLNHSEETDNSILI
jgi:acyl transferase domain-containing protein/acyl carrier protein